LEALDDSFEDEEQVCVPVQPQLDRRAILGSCAAFSFLSIAIRVVVATKAKLGAEIMRCACFPHSHLAGKLDSLIRRNIENSPQSSQR
jgi:hypothetical protein